MSCLSVSFRMHLLRSACVWLGVATALSCTACVRFSWAQEPSFKDGCMIISLRATSKPAPSLDGTCQFGVDTLLTRTGQFRNVYEWMAPLLVQSFDLAEAALCSRPGCMTGGRHVRLVVVARGLPYAQITPEETFLDVVLSSGLVDYAIQPHRPFAEDVIQGGFIVDHSRSLLAAWFDVLRQAGGRDCNYRVDWPSFPPIAEQDLVRLNLMFNAQISTLQFVFAHELAHLRGAENCIISDTEDTHVEMYCDAVAMRALLRSGTVSPAGPLVAYTALAQWEALRAPRLRSFNYPIRAGDFREVHPSRAWDERADNLIGIWEDFCDRNSDTRACGGDPAITHAMLSFFTDLGDRPLPAACVERVRR
jgi:hypothetical protein